MDKSGLSDDRVIERGRGCWSCVHWNNGELASNHYASKMAEDQETIDNKRMIELPKMAGGDDSVLKVAREAAKLIGEGIPHDRAIDLAMENTGNKNQLVADAIKHAQRQDARHNVYAQAMKAGQIGICLKGVPKGDFVEYRFLCDQWSGVEGASVATEGHELDKLPEELAEE